MTKSSNVILLMACALLVFGCGRANSGYTQSLITKASTTAGAAATSTAPTPVQGFWESTCTSGVIVSWDFNGNGFFTTTDTYSSSDCSDSQPASSVAQSGTFQLGANPQSGYAQTITLNVNAVGGTQSESGSVFVLATSPNQTLYVTVSGSPTVSLSYVGAY